MREIREIKNAIPIGGRLYGPGDEAALEALLTPAQIGYLKAKGAISGPTAARTDEGERQADSDAHAANLDAVEASESAGPLRIPEDTNYRVLRRMATERGLNLGRNPSKQVLLDALNAVLNDG